MKYSFVRIEDKNDEGEVLVTLKTQPSRTETLFQKKESEEVQFYGRCTVWRSWPSGKRCSTSMEALICDFHEGFKNGYYKNKEREDSMPKAETLELAKKVSIGASKATPKKKDELEQKFLDRLGVGPTKEIGLKRIQSKCAEREIEWRASGEDLTKTEDLLFRSNELGDECGEVQGAIKKLIRHQKGWVGGTSEEDALENLREELGDVVICAARIANVFDIDLQKATNKKFNQTSEKYGLKTKIEKND